MENQPYLNREIDEFLEHLKGSLETIEKQVKYTNGKVKKIIIFMVLLGGVLIGQTFTNLHDIILFISGFIH